MTMNRKDFDAYKDSLPADCGLRRLDDMNPFAAMRYLKQVFADATTDPGMLCDEALTQWARSLGAAQYLGRAFTSAGVRATLDGLFAGFAAQGRELWLPEDVYPYYHETADRHGLVPRSFRTLPEPDFAPLADAATDAVLLISSPLSPLGRSLRDDETTALQSWLAAAPARRLVLDTVYDYQAGLDGPTRALLDTGQCYAAHSLSKIWLERGVFGVVIAPAADAAAAKAAIAPARPESCRAAIAALRSQPDLPATQQTAFRDAWARLTPEIRNFAPDFTPPDNGYFALIRGDFAAIRERFNTLVIPASVFGSPQHGLAVVSCLAYIRP